MNNINHYSQKFDLIIKNYKYGIIQILFDLPDKIYLDPIKEEDYKNAFYRQIIQDILDSFDESLNIQEHIVDRINSGNPNYKDNVKQICLSMGKKLSHDILKRWSMEITKKAKSIVVDVDKDEEGIFIQFKIEGEEGVVISQEPQANKSVEEGSIIDVVVQKSEE